MFTRKISNQTKWMLVLVILPLYFFCGSLIGSAILMFVVNTFSLSVDNLALTAILNVCLNFAFVLLGASILKESLLSQWKDFVRDVKEHCKYAFLIGPGLLFAANILGLLITMVFVSQNMSENQALIESMAHTYPVLMVLTTVILAPIFEELLFRGMIFGWLYEVNAYFAHVVSGFIFGFIHIMNAIISGNYSEWFMIFAYMFMGMVLSYLYEKRNNIYVPILAHSTMNLLSMMMVLFGI